MPIKVLIAEDQGMVLGALAALLEIESDIEVVARARDGREALLLAQQTQPDVILTDIEMPYMTGTEMLTELKRSPRLAQIPVIVLTTAANERGHQGFEELGVEFVLSKRRFVDAELKELVERCLRRN